MADRQYFDAVAGQAAYFGTVQVGSETAMVTIRVRVEDRALTEAEWCMAHADDPGIRGPHGPGTPLARLHSPACLEQHPPPQRVVRRAERADRIPLLRIVESYFDALTSHDCTLALAHEGCGRAENSWPAPGGAFLSLVDPSSTQTESAFRDYLAGLENLDVSVFVARRVPLTEVESQFALSFAGFIRRLDSPTPRNVFSEWFAIDDAKIRTIYTSMFYPAAMLPVSNWPPLYDNWPLPAGVVPDLQEVFRQ